MQNNVKQKHNLFINPSAKLDCKPLENLQDEKLHFTRHRVYIPGPSRDFCMHAKTDDRNKSLKTEFLNKVNKVCLKMLGMDHRYHILLSSAIQGMNLHEN